MTHRESGRWPEIDIIKGIAMIMVILVHFNQSFVPDILFVRFFQMGCQLFLVASGFGAGLSFHKKRRSHSFRQTTRIFYTKRFLSIAPAWYCMLVFNYTVGSILFLAGNSSSAFGTNREFLSVLCNALFLQGLLPFCNNNVMPGGWYIGTTMLLYLLTPVLFRCMARLGRIPRILFTILSSLVAIACMPLLSVLLPQYENLLITNNSFGYFFVLTQYPCYALGLLLFFEIKGEKPLLSGKVPAQISSFLKLIAGICLMVMAVVLFLHPNTKYAYILDASLVGASVFFLLYFLMEMKGSHFNGMISHDLAELGKKSLFIYLVHFMFAWPFVLGVKQIAANLGFYSESPILYGILIPITVGLSYIAGCILQRIVAALLSLFKNIRQNLKPSVS